MTIHSSSLKPLPFILLLIVGLPLWVGLWLCWYGHCQLEGTPGNGKTQTGVCRDYLPGNKKMRRFEEWCVETPTKLTRLWCSVNFS